MDFPEFFIQTCAERMSLPELADDADGMISWAREMWMWIGFCKCSEQRSCGSLVLDTTVHVFRDQCVFSVSHSLRGLSGL